MSYLIPEFMNLHCYEGTSDKLYQIRIEKSHLPNKYFVKADYGRRGAAMKEAIKTPEPVGQNQAYQVYLKVVNEKRKKNYNPVGTIPPKQVIKSVADGILMRWINFSKLIDTAKAEAILRLLHSPDEETFNLGVGMIESIDKNQNK